MSAIDHHRVSVEIVETQEVVVQLVLELGSDFEAEQQRVVVVVVLGIDPVEMGLGYFPEILLWDLGLELEDWTVAVDCPVNLGSAVDYQVYQRHDPVDVVQYRSD